MIGYTLPLAYREKRVALRGDGAIRRSGCFMVHAVVSTFE